MLRMGIRRSCIVLLSCLVIGAPGAGRKADLPDDFGAGAYKHVESLASLGVRPAGSVNEGRAVEYVSNQLREAGLEVHVEPFVFPCFEWSAAELQVGGASYVPEKVGFNPYEEGLTYTGEMTLLDPDLPSEQFEQLDLQGASVVTAKTDSPLTYFRLLAKMPTLIILLGQEDYEELEQSGNREFVLRVEGSTRRYHSANVIGILPAPQPTLGEIIISAHLDSYKYSPGADDNGSGVGVMIELARYFAGLQDERTVNLKFAAFGAEEVGVLGARMYLSRHETEMKNCRLVFNIDRVGGSGHAHIEALGGIMGIPLKQGSSQIPVAISDKSWEGLESSWALNAPDVVPLMGVSNRPSWLVDVIRESIDETALQVSLAGNLGGDSLVFSQAGIVASGMAIGGNPVHTPEDVPSRINVQSLKDCGRLVSTLVRKVMERKPWQSSRQSHGPSATRGTETSRSAEMALPALITDAQRFEQQSNHGRFETLKSLLCERDLDFEVQHVASKEGEGGFSRQGNNVVLTFGKGDRALVVGAHFDAARLPNGEIGPGMVDNAAGVVVLIRLAQAIRDYSFNHRIDIVFFDLEETGQIGSEQYVDTVGADRIEAMINVDIVGYGDTLIYGPSSGNEQVRLSRAVRNVCSRLSIDCLSSPLLPVGDFRSFEVAGVPSMSLGILPSAEAHQVWLMFNKPEESGLRDDFVPRIGRVVHTIDDTVDGLDPVAMTMAYKVLERVLVELDRSHL